MVDVATLAAAIGSGGLSAITVSVLAGLFVGLTPGAYLAGPAVLSYMTVDAGTARGALLTRAAAYVLGTAIPIAAFGLLAGLVGDAVLAAVGTQAVTWYLLVAVVTVGMGLLLTGSVVPRFPAYLPVPRRVASNRGAFLLGISLGLAACPACTPLLFPMATFAAGSGGPLYGAGLLFLFGLSRGIPIFVAAMSLEALHGLRALIPIGLLAQRAAGWLLILTRALYAFQALLVASGRPALFT